jgi:hypothetical protein
MGQIKTICFLCCLICICANLAFSPVTQEELNLLSGTFTQEDLARLILPKQEWHPYPKSGERSGWDLLPQALREAHIRQAEKHLNQNWLTPKASVFLEYVRNGNRSNYERVSFGRRVKLAELVLGECFEGKGRFLDDILNGVWAICEETYWGVPAHIGVQEAGAGLPDAQEPTVDLFAAETGMLLAWTHYLVGEELDALSPLVRKRIVYEVDRRIISSNLERDDYWWMGFTGRKVNNWNPWICSNWLTAVLLLEDNQEKRIQSVFKILQCLDNFLNPYPRDGGCDEGPGYWSRAGGSLFDCLELLHSVSQGRIDIFDQPLIQEMGRYISRAYIMDRYYINFADAAARLNPDASLIYRYGKNIKDKEMMEFGSFLAQQQNLGADYLKGSFGALGRLLPVLFQLEELQKMEPHAPFFRDTWFPELEVMAARSYAGSSKGLYLAAKGGHNAESHNHNDVGNFIVYADGYPALIDVGVETYTAKTFSSQRYQIWTMQSAYHNLPTVNGVMQREGDRYRASEVTYRADNSKAVFELDITDAYPPEAKLKSWKRSLTLNRGCNVIVEDRYELAEAMRPVRMSFMSWRKPELISPGTLQLHNPKGLENVSPLSIQFDPDQFTVIIEELQVLDSRLQSSWGDYVYRILLTSKDITLTGSSTIALLRFGQGN